MEYSTEELWEREQLTEKIIHNLEIINKDENVDLETLAKTTSSICRDLDFINTNDIDLDELDQQTSRVCADLCQIDANETNLEGLADQTGEIVANFETIETRETAS